MSKDPIVPVKKQEVAEDIERLIFLARSGAEGALLTREINSTIDKLFNYLDQQVINRINEFSSHMQSLGNSGRRF